MRARRVIRLLFLAALPAAGQTLYSFGNPTGDEQMYIELINRARANPPAEGARLAATTDTSVQVAYAAFNVDLAMMQREYNAIAPAPPVAPNEILTTIARNHSNWMYANATQSHYQNGLKPGDRATAAGYIWSHNGENIYASVVSPFYGHASFAVDWGNSGTGGMQTNRGHRATMHNPVYEEVGVGVTYGTKGIIGPQLVTQDFFRLRTNPTLATGVAFYDLDRDGSYDSGEGISALTVNVGGASYYCRTAAGGGWVVPVPEDAATRNVTFTGNGINRTVSINIPANTNAKADLKLDYAPPAITSSATAYRGHSHTVSFNAVPGATSYVWDRWTAVDAPDDNAESLLGVVFSLLGAQPTLNILVKAQGLSSYQIVNKGECGDRWIQLPSLYRGQAAATLAYQSRIGWSSSAERFKVQVKEEGMGEWLDVDVQTGFNGAGQSTFSQRTVSLSSMEGRNFRIRFNLSYALGAYYPPTLLNATGWFIDAIQFTNMLQLQDEVSIPLAGTTGTFTPDATGTWYQSVQPVVSGREFPPAYQTLTITTGAPPAPATGFTAWAANLENTYGLPAGTLSNTMGDYDRDGRVNFLEYAFGSSPLLASEATPRWPVISRAGNNVVMDYKRDTTLSDVVFSAEASTNLSSWRAPGESGAPAGFSDQVLSTSGSIQHRRATVPISSAPKVFMRVKVEKAP